MKLRQWASMGILSGLSDTTKVAVLPDWKDDKHFSLDQRARAYLDMNCAHCHTQGGDAMPELARTIIDKEGVQLIKNWINRMLRTGCVIKFLII